MAAYITRTTATSFTSRQKFTASMWVKGDTPPAADTYWWSIGSGSAHITIYTASNGKINIIGSGPSSNWYQYSKLALRDPAAWYHVLISVDTTQSVANDRIKLSINGTLYADDADWNSRGYPDEDDELDALVSGEIQYIGSNYGASGEEWEGLMSHVHYCDGYNYAASDFGEFDATSGIWKIKTSPSVTYGNNGYFLKMEDRTNLDLDSGTNAFTFTTTGTLTATYDNPSNNFATPNLLSKGSTVVLSNGNTTIAKDSGWLSCMGTFGMDASKWYWEQKVAAVGNANAGITMSKQDGTSHSSVDATRIMYGSDGNVYNEQGSTTATGTTFTTGDIISVALDCAGDTVKFYKNNVLIHTETETDISDNQWSPAWGMSSGTWDTNFGNGYFGTTAVTSAEADDAGIGAFEYAPPTGYYALCTKNIKAYGG